jgi:hypothetical protein
MNMQAPKFEIKDVQTTSKTKFHFYLTNVSRRPVNLPQSALGKTRTSVIMNSLTNVKIVNQFAVAESARLLGENYLTLLPGKAVGVHFKDSKTQEYWFEREWKRLGSLGIVITDDNNIPLRDGDISQIKLEAQKAIEAASEIDSNIIKGHLEQSMSSKVKSNGFKKKVNLEIDKI